MTEIDIQGQSLAAWSSKESFEGKGLIKRNYAPGTAEF
jgi:hypothetical protein